MAIPTWKDYFVALGTATDQTFTIETGGSVIYSGRVYSKTGTAAPLYCNPMPVIRDYIRADYVAPDQNPQGHGEHTIRDDSVRTFTVRWGGNSTTVDVYLDYSHVDVGNPTPATLRNDPVNGRTTAVCGIWLTSFGLPSVDIFRNDPLMIGQREILTFGADISYWNGAESSVIIFPGTNTVDLNATAPDGRHLQYIVLPECHRWALDYLNAWGGWDTLLIEGTWLFTDGYDRRQFRAGESVVSKGNAYDPAARDLTDYLNIITRRLDLNTGLLTDDEAGRMHHLLGSTQVYLRDLWAPVEFPSVAVNIVNSECRHQRHANGGGIAQYTITVEYSQQMFRQ